MSGFLQIERPAISRFVLLDHMDWLATVRGTALADEWQAIVDCAAPESRVIWRSGGLQRDFVDRVVVRAGNRQHRVAELLDYNDGLAARLHPLDRVHTYGSFWIARTAAV